MRMIDFKRDNLPVSYNYDIPKWADTFIVQQPNGELQTVLDHYRSLNVVLRDGYLGPRLPNVDENPLRLVKVNVKLIGNPFHPGTDNNLLLNVPRPGHLRSARTDVHPTREHYSVLHARLRRKLKEMEAGLGETLAEVVVGYASLRRIVKHGLERIIRLLKKEADPKKQKRLNRRLLRSLRRSFYRIEREKQFAEYKRLRAEHFRKENAKRRKDRKYKLKPFPKFKPGPYPEFPKELEELAREWHSKPLTERFRGKASHAYLAWVWCVAPTLTALRDTVKVLDAGANYMGVVRTGLDFTEEYSRYHGKYKAMMVGRHRIRARVKAGYQASLFDKLGIGVINLWQVLPLSFVVDWFVNISGVIEQSSFRFSMIQTASRSTTSSMQQSPIEMINMSVPVYRYERDSNGSYVFKEKLGERIVYYEYQDEVHTRSNNFSFDWTQGISPSILTANLQKLASPGKAFSLTVLLSNMRKLL